MPVTASEKAGGESEEAQPSTSRPSSDNLSIASGLSSAGSLDLGMPFLPFDDGLLLCCDDALHQHAIGILEFESLMPAGEARKPDKSSPSSRSKEKLGASLRAASKNQREGVNPPKQGQDALRAVGSTASPTRQTTGTISRERHAGTGQSKASNQEQERAALFEHKVARGPRSGDSGSKARPRLAGSPAQEGDQSMGSDCDKDPEPHTTPKRCR